jgi:hypothetical protein
MSDTPRTDVAEHNMGSIMEPHYVVDADFSRYLERELVEARRQRDKAIAAERERCALVCEEFYSVEGVAQKCAEAIRGGE